MRLIKIVPVIAAALSMTASAAWDKVCVVQVADVSAFANATAKLGEITGNQMLSAMTAGFFMEPPGSKFFGPMRPGASAALPIYIDSAAMAKDKEFDFDDDALGFALLYPMTISRAEFIKLHPGAVETNGLVRVKGSIDFDKDDDDDDDGSFTYVAFTADGKWACASPDLAQASRSIADVKLAERPLRGNLARVYGEPGGVAILRKLAASLAEEAKKKKERFDGRICDALAGIDSFSAGIKVGDAGIDLDICAKTVAGTEMAKVGLVSLPADPLAFAGPDAISASSDAGLRNVDPAEAWNAIVSILKRHGLDVSSFITLASTPAAAHLKFDVKALVKYATGPATNALAKIDVDKLTEEVKNCKVFDIPLKAADKPQNTAFSVAGYKPKFTAAQRFAATFPEAKGRPLFGAGVISLSAFLQAVVPAIMAELPEKDRAGIQPFLAFMPQEAGAGIGVMQWRDKDRCHFVLRISSGELKGIGTAVTAAMAASMTKDEE